MGRRRRTFWLVALAALAGSCTHAPSAGTSRPPQTATSQAAVDPKLAAALQAALAEWRRQTDTVGVTMAVRLPAGGSWAGAAGLADRRRLVPLRPADRLRVASITKMFVATVVLGLVQDGVMRLEDPLARYVPGFPHADRITIRQLLSHTSGVADYVGLPAFDRALRHDPNRAWQPEQIAALAGRQPLRFAPGHDYSYSNTNYVLLGLAVQAATHTPLVQLLHRRVFAPAGLGDTLLAGAEPVHGGIVHGYGRVNIYRAHPVADGKEHVYDGVPHQPGTLPYRAFETASAAPGGIVSTAPDLVRFATALFHGDLLHAATREQMLTFGTDPYRYYSYGLGVQLIATWAGPGWGHGGGMPGYSSILVDVPGSQITVAVLSNQEGRALGPLVDKVLQVLHAARHAFCDGRPC